MLSVCTKRTQFTRAKYCVCVQIPGKKTSWSWFKHYRESRSAEVIWVVDLTIFFFCQKQKRGFFCLFVLYQSRLWKVQQLLGFNGVYYIFFQHSYCVTKVKKAAGASFVKRAVYHDITSFGQIKSMLKKMHLWNINFLALQGAVTEEVSVQTYTNASHQRKL